MTARELLAAVRAAQGWPSNYALARAMGYSDNTVTRWNVGANTPDDATAARLAELAGLDPDAVVAAMHAQRAHDPAERARWQRIAERLAAPAAVLLALLGFSGGPDGGALASPAAGDGRAAVSYVNSFARLRRALARLAAAVKLPTCTGLEPAAA